MEFLQVLVDVDFLASLYKINGGIINSVTIEYILSIA